MITAKPSKLFRTKNPRRLAGVCFFLARESKFLLIYSSLKYFALFYMVLLPHNYLVGKLGCRHMNICKYKRKGNVSGQNIRALRKKNGISQSQLAAKLQVEGINLERISIIRIEKGERVVADYELRTLAKIFHVKIEELVEPDRGTE